MNTNRDCMKKSCLSRCFAILAALVFAAPLAARADVNWIGGTDNNWQTAANWSGSSGHFYLDGTKAAIRNLVLTDNVTDTDKDLVVRNSDLADPFVLNGQGYALFSTANTGKTFVFADDSDAAFRFYNGTLNYYQIKIGKIGNGSTHYGILSLGSEDTVTTVTGKSNWNILLSNGELWATNTTLTVRNYSNRIMFNVGEAAGSVGLVDKTGGDWTISGLAHIASGENSTATFRDHGGGTVAWKDQLHIASGAGSTATIEKAGGDWTSSGIPYICKGNNSSASFYHRGGSWTVSNYLVVGGSGNGVNHAYFEISGGAVTNATHYVTIGDQDCDEASTAKMRVTGDGEYYSVGVVDVGSKASGELTVDGNGRVTASTNLRMARDSQFSANETSVVNLNGGMISVNSVAYGSGNGQATFNFNGGTLQARGEGATLIARHDRLAVKVGANGGTIDANEHSITIAEDLASGVDGATDGGLSFKGGNGKTVTLSGAVSYTGATTVELGTTLSVATSESVAAILGGGLKAAYSDSTADGTYVILTRTDNGGSFTASDLDFCSAADGSDNVSFSLSADRHSIVASFGSIYTWTGAANDGGNFSSPANWSLGGSPAATAPGADAAVLFDGDEAVSVTLDADATVSEIAFNGTAAVTFVNPNAATTNTLTTGSMASASPAAVTNVFNCAVAFKGTYDVNFASPVDFAGGATSTCPDADVALRGEFSHLLLGVHSWTNDWTAPRQAWPFLVPDGSRLTGRALTGNWADSNKEANNPSGLALRIEEGGSGEFDSVTAGNNIVRVSIWGALKVNGVYSVNATSGSGHVGFDGDEAHNGVVYAEGVHKAGSRSAYVKVSELYVGADGIGSATSDYSLRFSGGDKTVHFTADSEVKGVERPGYLYDWGVVMDSGADFDTAGHAVTWNAGIQGNGAITKSGLGTLVMQPYGSTGNRNVNVNAGTLVLSNSVDIAGTGTFTVAQNATLEVASDQTLKLSGAGDVVKKGSGTTLALSGAGGFTGSLSVEEGGLALASAVASGASLAAADGTTVTAKFANGAFTTENLALTLDADTSGSVTLVIDTSAASPADDTDYTLFASSLTPEQLARLTIDAAYRLSVAEGVVKVRRAPYVWSGAADDGGRFTTAGNWSVGGAAATVCPTEQSSVVFDGATPVTVVMDADKAVAKLTFNGAAAVTFENPDAETTNTLTVATITDASATTVTNTFNCAVAFAETYDVDFASPVNFAGGATATRPGAVSGAYGKTLTGDITFTGDWTLTDSGWVVPTGSRLTGQLLTGSGSVIGRDNVDLRISDGAIAHFASVVGGRDLLHLSVQGELDVDGDYTIQSIQSKYPGFVGYNGDQAFPNSTIRARGVYRNARESSYTVTVYPANFYIGAGGFGTTVKDYEVVLDGCDKTIHATDDFEVKGVYKEDRPADWGLTLKRAVTIDTAGHVVTWNAGFMGNGAITKSGEGTLVMQPYGVEGNHAISVNGGTLVLSNAVNVAGTGAFTVAQGGTLEVACDSFANTLTGVGNLALTGTGMTISGNLSGFTGTVTVGAGATFASVPTTPEGWAEVPAGYVEVLTVPSSSSAKVTFPTEKVDGRYYFVRTVGDVAKLCYGKRKGLMMIVR